MRIEKVKIRLEQDQYVVVIDMTHEYPRANGTLTVFRCKSHQYASELATDLASYADCELEGELYENR